MRVRGVHVRRAVHVDSSCKTAHVGSSRETENGDVTRSISSSIDLEQRLVEYHRDGRERRGDHVEHDEALQRSTPRDDRDDHDSRFMIALIHG